MPATNAQLIVLRDNIVAQINGLIASGPIPPEPPIPPQPPVPGAKVWDLEVPPKMRTITTITQGVRTPDTVIFTFVAPNDDRDLKMTCTFVSGPITMMHVKFSDVPGDFSNYETTNYIPLRMSTTAKAGYTHINKGQRYYLNIRFEDPQTDNNADLSMQFSGI